MIDERKLLNDLEKGLQYYDKDGRQVSPDNFILRVSDVKKLIEGQERFENTEIPVSITRESTTSTTWSEIKTAALDGTLKSLFKSGDILPLTLSNGDEVNLIVGFDESGRAYFIFDRAMSDRHVMNKEWTNEGGYAGPDMAEYADTEVYAMLPGYLQDMIVPTTIVQNWGGECRETKHKLFCLSYTQVFGKDEYFAEQEPEDTQIDIFKDVKSRVKVRCGAECASWWWLRSANYNNNFYYVYSDGSSNYCYANTSGAVVLGFCIEPNQ